MTAFRDSGHSWWQQCSSCNMTWPLAQKPFYGTLHKERCAHCVAATENIDYKAQRDEAYRLLGSEREALALALALREDALKIVTALEVSLSDEEKLRRRLEKSCEAAERLAASHETEARVRRHERDTAQKRAETYLKERDAAIAEAGRWKALLSEAQRDLAAARKARDEARWACAKVEGCIDAHETQERSQAYNDATEVHWAQGKTHPRHPTTLDVEATSRHTHWRWLEACEAALNGKDWEGLRQLRSIGPLLISG